MSQDQMRDEELTIDKVSSGDRPSLYALGLAVSAALKGTSTAVVMVDVLGRVRLMPSDAVSVLRTPKLTDEELHAFQEEYALQLLAAQGDSDEEIMEYLARRKAAEG